MIEIKNNESLEEKQRRFYDVLSIYFSEKWWPSGFFNAVGGIDKKLEQLNENLFRANESSSKLTKALNRITLAGVIIFGLTLIWSIVVYFI